MHELWRAVPVIFSLVIIEGLLSVDNAMAIAAMASGLPPALQKRALRYGIVGAYVLRGLSLACGAWIIAHLWIKVAGAIYLLYLMVKNLSSEEAAGETNGARRAGFWATVLSIELMDLSLSLDNIVAAVALDGRLWVVLTGVFIGIFVLRFVAGLCIQLIERFPILKAIAFVLVGYIGVLLLLDAAAEYAALAWRTPDWLKFGGIGLIVAGGMIGSRGGTPLEPAGEDARATETPTAAL